MYRDSVSSSSSDSVSDSSSEYNVNQVSLPLIKVSNYDEAKSSMVAEHIIRGSSNRLNFDPKNLIKGTKAKMEEMYEF